MPLQDPEPLSPELMLAATRGPQVPTIGDAYAKMQQRQLAAAQLQGAQQERQLRDIQIQDAQRNLDQTKAINDAWRNAVKVNSDGTTDVDEAGLSKTLAAGGHGAAIPGIIKSVQDFHKAGLELQKTRGEVDVQERDAAGALGASVRAAGNDPQVMLGLIDQAVVAKHVDPNSVAPMRAQIAQAMQQDPTGAAAKKLTEQIAGQFIDASPKFRELESARVAAEARQKASNTGADAEQQKKDASYLNAAGAAQSQQQLDAIRATAKQAGVSDAALARMPGMWSETGMQGFNRSIRSSEQNAQIDQAAATLQNTKDYQGKELGIRQQEANARTREASIAAQRFSAEYGGDAVKGWAAAVAQNPDSAQEVPGNLRSSVMAAHAQMTGLPWPKPLQGTAVNQEAAANRALQAVKEINQDIQDPEVQKSLGPVLGNIGNVEGDLGMNRLGLSDSAAQKAARLRGNMRYLFTSELQSQLGARPAAKLADMLKSASPRVNMNDPILKGSLEGLSDAALRTLDAADQQRYGAGKMRSRAARSLPESGSLAKPAASLPAGGGRVIDRDTARKFYDAAGGDPRAAQALAEKYGWKVQQ